MINLKSRIQNRQSTIAIIGLGYVGLPLAIRFSEEGFKTIGFDIDKEKVDLLNNGKSYIKHIKEDNIAGKNPNNLLMTKKTEINIALANIAFVRYIGTILLLEKAEIIARSV